MSESRVRENRMPGLKRRGLETERQTGVTATGVAQPTGKPAEHEGPRTYHTGEATAPVPDPTESLLVNVFMLLLGLAAGAAAWFVQFPNAARAVDRPAGGRVVAS